MTHHGVIPNQICHGALEQMAEPATPPFRDVPEPAGGSALNKVRWVESRTGIPRFSTSPRSHSGRIGDCQKCHGLADDAQPCNQCGLGMWGGR